MTIYRTPAQKAQLSVEDLGDIMGKSVNVSQGGTQMRIVVKFVEIYNGRITVSEDNFNYYVI